MNANRLFIRDLDFDTERLTVDEARRELAAAIRRARQAKVCLLKIIHGYGSSGKGGALYDALRKSLKLRQKEGVIRSWVRGEDFYATDSTTLVLLDKHPELAQDVDYGRRNPGITIVEVSDGPVHK
jgi:DNA-nicking Smr family endonuclease